MSRRPQANGRVTHVVFDHKVFLPHYCGEIFDARMSSFSIAGG